MELVLDKPTPSFGHESLGCVAVRCKRRLTEGQVEGSKDEAGVKRWHKDMSKDEQRGEETVVTHRESLGVCSPTG